ncbi:hypothetical protein SAY86_017536 [Trapa natans]|uniref:Uncharacterized protein n=1 Tax=Trapa natans TaxID=22666 RepID=A0AAN7R561_TRANT|nr:hypothetical protein SAY86_017536 [Trapa natans]
MSGEGTELGNPLLGFLIFTSEDTNQITTRFPLLRLINVQVLLKILGFNTGSRQPKQQQQQRPSYSSSPYSSFLPRKMPASPPPHEFNSVAGHRGPDQDNDSQPPWTHRSCGDATHLKNVMASNLLESK